MVAGFLFSQGVIELTDDLSSIEVGAWPAVRGDRNNNRIQIFDQGGNFFDEWRQFGRPGGLLVDRNDILKTSTAPKSTGAP